MSLLKQTDEFLTRVKSEDNGGQQAGKEENFFEETESALGIGGAWGNVASIAVYDSERHSRYHRISVERFKELSDFTYDRYNPDDLPIEDGFVKRLWTDNYEERCDIPHDEGKEVRD